MLTDQELIEGLRAGLAPLCPPSDLIDRLREETASRPRDGIRRRVGLRTLVAPSREWASAGRLALAASGLVVAVVVVGALMLLGDRQAPAGLPTSVVHQPAGKPGRALTPGTRIHPILTGSGLNRTPFGSSRSELAQLLDPVLGRPQRVDRVTGDCGVDETLTWPILISAATKRPVGSEQLTIFLGHDGFVGYQYGDATLAPRGSGHLRLRATTTRGLALGDGLRIGRLIYGPAFQISSAQGGTWKVHTATGTLSGYAYGHPRHGDVSSRSLVASIDAGDTGCPALSP